ncbi:hypothetical protein [Saccharicrinis fermentans]|uniref:Uncharacterized protein n=2 Tax=Saccharicrinis fermentans TaxID=982 RepID=W7YGX3_9BACT|nr:hypothetical protein [Saccharicrinis fermentans]GAF03646.1 hypothetical protein JCM21142_52325 [Saccharicrinis fermentans DSM 9555 = JCM 21142]
MYSLKLENEVGEQARVYSNAGSLFSLKAGVTYIVRYKRYLTASADLAGGDKLYIATGTNVAVKQINNVENLLDDVNSNKMCHVFAGKPAESWYAMEFEFTPDEDYNDAYFNLQINPKVGVFYYDDFYIAIKASKRP